MAKTAKMSEEHHELVKEIKEESEGIGTPSMKEVVEESIEQLHSEVVEDGEDGS